MVSRPPPARPAALPPDRALPSPTVTAGVRPVDGPVVASSRGPGRARGGGAVGDAGPHRSHTRRWWVAAVLVAGLAGCRSDAVAIAFRPPPGAVSAYELVITTRVEADVPGLGRTGSDTTRLVLTQRVLGTDGAGTRVAVEVAEPPRPPRRFEVVLDHLANLVEVEVAEGLSASVAAELGLGEILPPAAAPVPDRLEMGRTWTLDTAVRLGTVPTRITGEGRLVRLGVRDGVPAALVRTTARMPVRLTVPAPSGTAGLDGVQSTAQETWYRLEDGTVLSSEARTVSRYAVRLNPPEDSPGLEPVTGSLTVEIHSRTNPLEGP